MSALRYSLFINRRRPAKLLKTTFMNHVRRVAFISGHESLNLRMRMSMNPAYSKIIHRGMAVANAQASKLKSIEEDLTQINKKVPSSASQLKELKSYLSSVCSESEIQLLPSRLKRLTRSEQASLYLVDKSVAESIASLLQAESLDPNIPTIEFNPNLGYLTSHLVSPSSLGLKYLTLLEPNENEGESIKYLSSKFGNAVGIIPTNFIYLPRLNYQDKMDPEGMRVSTLFEQVRLPSSNYFGNYNGEPDLHIIGAMPLASSISFIIRSFASQSVLFNPDLPWSNPAFFLLVTPKTLTSLLARPGSGLDIYRRNSILFQLFFEHKILGKVPSKAFLPWKAKIILRRKRRIFEDEDQLSLIKFSLKKNIVEDLGGYENLFGFYFFVRQHFNKRKSGIIAEMEKWIPGIGEDLIKRGYSVFGKNSRFGSQTPEEILALYKLFIAHPHFSTCSFLSAVEKFQAQLELPEEDREDAKRERDKMLDSHDDHDHEEGHHETEDIHTFEEGHEEAHTSEDLHQEDQEDPEDLHKH